MEEKNKSNQASSVLIICVAIAIIALVVAICMMNNIVKSEGHKNIFAYFKDSLNGQTVQTSEDQEIEQEVSVETSKSNLEKYSSVIQEYKYAMENKKEDNDYGDNVNSNMITYYHQYKDFDIAYAFYDINNDNNDEMIVLKKSDSTYTIIDIHGFNGTNAVRLIKNNSIGDRSQIELFDNGIIYLIGSNGATNGGISIYTFNDDGYTLSSDDIYYFYDDSNNVTFYSDYDKTNELDYTSIQDILNKYQDESSEVNVEDLDIKTIEVK